MSTSSPPDNPPGDKPGGKYQSQQTGEVLQVTKLRFSKELLTGLNYHLLKKLPSCSFEDEADNEKGVEKRIEEKDSRKDFSTVQAASIVERLIQRLLCAVGNLDPRFSTKYLINLHDNTSKDDRTTLEYIVRLDSLSTPVLYPKDPIPSYEVLEFDGDGISPGFARIRLRNKTSTTWAEFINSSGYLRRDKIQERFVELLALAAAGSWPNSSLDVDDSTLCAAPGKIMNAATLNRILHTDPEEHVYYGPASSSTRFPDPRDFRLAIVDAVHGVLVRVGFLAPAPGRDLQVRLLLGVGIDAWPRTTSFPHRVEVGHPDAWIYQQMAKTGMFLTAIGQQSSSWQILLPAAEDTLLLHYGPSCSVTQILQILYAILDEIHAKVNEDHCKYHCKLLSRRIIRETVYTTLESTTLSPLHTMADWSSANLSRQLVRLLDKLIGSLRNQQLPGFFFPGGNLLTNANATEEDYLVEANRLYMYLARLHSLPIPSSSPSYTSHLSRLLLDSSLISRWSELVSSMIPPAATRSSRFSFQGASRTEGSHRTYTHYSSRQVEYIADVLQGVLDVKQSGVMISQNTTEFQYSIPEDPVEDIIYLLVTIIEQARDQTFTDKHTRTLKSRSKSNKSKYKTNNRSKSHYDAATAKLVEAVRKEKKKDIGDIKDNSILVKTILRWLYKAIDHSKHSLGPVLRPYLNRLFITSHELSLASYLDSCKRKEALDEFNALKMFCKLVNRSEVTPATGLIDSVNKGWTWASNMLSLVSQSPLRVIFTPLRGKTHRHILSLPSYDKNISSSKSMEDIQDRKMCTLPNRSRIGTSLSRNGNTMPKNIHQNKDLVNHNNMKELSPMTEACYHIHRRGNQRGATDLVEAFSAMNKISILQELSHLLPPGERRSFLSSIQHLSRQQKRQAAVKRRFTMPPSTKKTRQVYTPTEYFVTTAHLLNKQNGEEKSAKELRKETLIGSCRAARIKEDNEMVFNDNLKIQSIFKVD